jgi:hypothetical protein
MGNHLHTRGDDAGPLLAEIRPAARRRDAGFESRRPDQTNTYKNQPTKS